MNSDEVFQKIRNITLCIPAGWCDAKQCHGPKKLLYAEFKYTVSKDEYRAKMVFAVGNRDIHGVGRTPFLAIQDALVKTLRRDQYGSKSLTGHAEFLP